MITEYDIDAGVKNTILSEQSQGILSAENDEFTTTTTTTTNKNP